MKHRAFAFVSSDAAEPSRHPRPAQEPKSKGGLWNNPSQSKAHLSSVGQGPKLLKDLQNFT